MANAKLKYLLSENEELKGITKELKTHSIFAFSGSLIIHTAVYFLSVV
jgi:hypothetical protein